MISLRQGGPLVSRRPEDHVARTTRCRLASPETILRWYRKPVAKKYHGSKKRGPGRPRKPAEIVRLLLRMALENPRWGNTRL